MPHSADPVVTGPLFLYLNALQEGRMQEDASQREVIDLLQALYMHLQGREGRGFLARWLPRRRQPGVKGLYIWGGVGRGKTCLMDLFFRSLPGQTARRMHFHRFMKRVHDDLGALKGAANPLERVGQALAREARVLCFDEFFVSDIGDAMLLGGLLEVLFREGVVLVATSNLPPHRLYERGLQRQRFLPAIELIETHTRVVNMDGGQDYRLRQLEKSGLYFTPLGVESEAGLEAAFRGLVGDQKVAESGHIEVLGRQIDFFRHAEGVLWCRFGALCETARSALDYIELARQFHTVFLSGVPGFGPERDDAARRFISLVDEFYDRRVKLILSAATTPEAMYTGTHLAFAFERTASRLREMQSHAYLASEHRP